MFSVAVHFRFRQIVQSSFALIYRMDLTLIGGKFSFAIHRIKGPRYEEPRTDHERNQRYPQYLRASVAGHGAAHFRSLHACGQKKAVSAIAPLEIRWAEQFAARDIE
jgi:hypothetical protein